MPSTRRKSTTQLDRRIGRPCVSYTLSVDILFSDANHRSFLYTLFLAIDANFRLKRRAVSNEERDPALISGQGYFVEDKTYREHLTKFVKQEEVSRFDNGNRID